MDHVESQETKDRNRREIEELTREFEANGGEVQVFTTFGAEYITHAEIRDRYGISDKQLRKWRKSRQFPFAVMRQELKKGLRLRDEYDLDRFSLREVEIFFTKRLWEVDGYQRTLRDESSHPFRRD